MEILAQPQLKAFHALLKGRGGDASLELLLTPFLRKREVVSTSMRLDGIRIPSIRLIDLVGHRFEFPINPADGFIDASTYLAHEHHPVDVHQLQFHRARDGSASVVVKGSHYIDYPSLGSGEAVPFVLAAPVSQCMVA
jgi:hypothetical protein